MGIAEQSKEQTPLDLPRQTVFPSRILSVNGSASESKLGKLNPALLLSASNEADPAPTLLLPHGAYGYSRRAEQRGGE